MTPYLEASSEPEGTRGPASPTGREDPASPTGPGPGAAAPPRPMAARRAVRWATGWSAGVAQALGAALLLITEFVREDVATLGRTVREGAALPGYAAGFPDLQAALGDQWWFRFAGELRDAYSFGEPRAALWAAVCAALVVRLNREGPPRTQCFLSLAGALYCVIAAVSAIPYLALAGFALPFALVLGAVAVVVTTRLGTAVVRRAERASAALDASATHDEPESAPCTETGTDPDAGPESGTRTDPGSGTHPAPEGRPADETFGPGSTGRPPASRR